MRLGWDHKPQVRVALCLLLQLTKWRSLMVLADLSQKD